MLGCFSGGYNREKTTGQARGILKTLIVFE
jgi:hypothetical protein